MRLLECLAAALRRTTPVVKIDQGAIIRPGDLVVMFDSLSGPGEALKQAVQSALPTGARVLYLPCAPSHVSIVNASRLIESATDEGADDRAADGDDKPLAAVFDEVSEVDPRTTEAGYVPDHLTNGVLSPVRIPVKPNESSPETRCGQ